MQVKHYIIRGCLLLFTMAATSLPESVAAADDIEVTPGFPRWGLSAKVLQDNWATAPVNVSNPGDTPREIIVQISADNKRLTTNAWQRRLICGPTAKCKYELMMPMTRTSSYVVTVARPGENFFSRTKIPANVQNGFGKTAIFVLNDNYKLAGISEVEDKENLIQNIALSMTPSREAPDHVLGYGGASIIVVLDIEFRALGEKQIKALRNFVHAGGTLLFASPRTIFELQNSALSDLLPGTPLRLRSIAALPQPDSWTRPDGSTTPNSNNLGLDKINKPAVTWPAAHGEILRFAPADDAVVSAAVEGVPLVCWRKTGLGRIGICTISPFDPQLRTTTFSDQLWNHLLAWHTDPPVNSNMLHSKPLKQAARRMVGFRAPRANIIGRILLFYFLLLALLFALGMALRRRLHAWVGAALAALLLTGSIFIAAYRQASASAPRTLTSLELNLNSPNGRVTESILGLFSKSDLRLDLTGTRPGIRFREPPPAPAPFPTSRTGNESVTVVRHNARSRVKGISLQALKPFRLSGYSEDNITNMPARTVKIRPGVNDWAASPQELPEDISGDPDLYVVMQNGFRKVKPAGSRWQLAKTGADKVQLDPVQLAIEKFLASGLLPAPCWVALSQSEKPQPWLEMEPDLTFKQVQKRIDLFPAEYDIRVDTDQNPTGRITINPEAIALVPFGTATGTLYWNREWQKLQIHSGGANYTLAAILPPELTPRLRVQKVELEITTLNPTGNIEVTTELLPVKAPGLETDDKDAEPVTATEQNAGRYLFSDLQKHEVFDPALGRIYIRLNLRNKLEKTKGALSATPWKIQNFKVKVQGDLL